MSLPHPKKEKSIWELIKKDLMTIMHGFLSGDLWLGRLYTLTLSLYLRRKRPLGYLRLVLYQPAEYFLENHLCVIGESP